MNFAKVLIDWYLIHKRDLPWRKTTDAYTIFLSEIILQQTRVNQGLPYFERFIDHYPTVFDLANSDEEEVLKLWQGLGYYSRARNMRAAAQQIVADYDGVYPASNAELLKLKGVGDYTAAAIGSFAYELPVAVVDGNVFRVLSRVFGIEADISVGSTKKIFREKAQELLPNEQSSIFNQAIMEFGALHCVPKNPVCTACVFNTTCVAFALGKVGVLPVKTKKIKVRKRYFNFLVIQDLNGHIVIQKRTGKGIWENLYQFPLIESERSLIKFELKNQIDQEFKKLGIYAIEDVDNEVVHKLSHQQLYIRFWSVKSNTVLEGAVTKKQLKNYPFPIVIANFIDELKSIEF